MARSLKRERKPLYLHDANSGYSPLRWSNMRQNTSSAIFGSRLRFAFENVLRRGTCAPRIRPHSHSKAAAASHTPLRDSVRVSCW